MRDIMLAFTYSPLIPIVLYLVYRPGLNVFFKLLLASIFLSQVSDIIGTLGFYQKNNLFVYSIYLLLNLILITTMWYNVPVYSSKTKKIVLFFGLTVLFIMLSCFFIGELTMETFYILSCLSVISGISFALQYYYQKIKLELYSPPLKDPYFIVASGFILFGLSTIILLAAQVVLKEHSYMNYTWTLRQLFYLIYNIIIAYSFYILYKLQLQKE